MVSFAYKSRLQSNIARKSTRVNKAVNKFPTLSTFSIPMQSRTQMMLHTIGSSSNQLMKPQQFTTDTYTRQPDLGNSSSKSQLLDGSRLCQVAY